MLPKQELHYISKCLTHLSHSYSCVCSSAGLKLKLCHYLSPSCLHMTLASRSVQCVSHTAPHLLFTYTSRRPLLPEPPTSLAAPTHTRKNFNKQNSYNNNKIKYHFKQESLWNQWFDHSTKSEVSLAPMTIQHSYSEETVDCVERLNCNLSLWAKVNMLKKEKDNRRKT